MEQRRAKIIKSETPGLDRLRSKQFVWLSLLGVRWARVEKAVAEIDVSEAVYRYLQGSHRPEHERGYILLYGPEAEWWERGRGPVREELTEVARLAKVLCG